MNTREEFEKVYKELTGISPENLKLAIDDIDCTTIMGRNYHNARLLWQACQALNDARIASQKEYYEMVMQDGGKRIAELEENLDRLLEKLGEQPYEQSAYALITEINQGIKKEMEARK